MLHEYYLYFQKSLDLGHDHFLLSSLCGSFCPGYPACQCPGYIDSCRIWTCCPTAKGHRNTCFSGRCLAPYEQEYRHSGESDKAGGRAGIILFLRILIHSRDMKSGGRWQCCIICVTHGEKVLIGLVLNRVLKLSWLQKMHFMDGNLPGKPFSLIWSISRTLRWAGFHVKTPTGIVSIVVACAKVRQSSKMCMFTTAKW